jgi:hypothetical protein
MVNPQSGVARTGMVAYCRATPDAATFTQPLQNEESIRAFRRGENMRRQRLDPLLRLSEMGGAVKAERGAAPDETLRPLLHCIADRTQTESKKRHLPAKTFSVLDQRFVRI